MELTRAGLFAQISRGIGLGAQSFVQNYFYVAPDLDMGELDPGRAREFGGRTRILVFQGRVYVADASPIDDGLRSVGWFGETFIVDGAPHFPDGTALLRFADGSARARFTHSAGWLQLVQRIR